jgi:hypothetical protein
MTAQTANKIHKGKGHRSTIRNVAVLLLTNIPTTFEEGVLGVYLTGDME